MKRGQLVRDRLPELYGQQGEYRVLNDEEFVEALRDKLQEEVAEYLRSGEIMELTDILEVVYALASAQGITSSELDYLRLEKAAQSGSFDERLGWNGEE